MFSEGLLWYTWLWGYFPLSGWWQDPHGKEVEGPPLMKEMARGGRIVQAMNNDWWESSEAYALLEKGQVDRGFASWSTILVHSPGWSFGERYAAGSSPKHDLKDCPPDVWWTHVDRLYHAELSWRLERFYQAGLFLEKEVDIPKRRYPKCMGCEKGQLGMVAQFGMYFLVHREPLSWASGWICISEPYRRGMGDLAVSNAVPLRERLQSDFSRYSGHIKAPFYPCCRLFCGTG